MQFQNFNALKKQITGEDTLHYNSDNDIPAIMPFFSLLIAFAPKKWHFVKPQFRFSKPPHSYCFSEFQVLHWQT